MTAPKPLAIHISPNPTSEMATNGNQSRNDGRFLDRSHNPSGGPTLSIRCFLLAECHVTVPVILLVSLTGLRVPR